MALADSEPVAIGGVGGSGTRVVAQMVRELGLYLGDDLNEALDNLWFTLLFRRPEMARRGAPAVPTAVHLFADAMRGEPPQGEQELELLRQARAETVQTMSKLRGNRDWDDWAQARIESLSRPTGPPPESPGWGWKEPCTHVFLEPLAEALPSLRYIHVIRNGLELTHSMLTQFQLILWARAYGLEPPPDPWTPEPSTLLRYWIVANRRAIAQGRRLFGEGFLLLRYESVCEDPHTAFEQIAGFLGVRPRQDRIERIAAFVRDPPPTRRDPSREVDAFPAEDLAAVEALGFPL